ncbi:bifunctional aspartate kinase/homoserine dehydrogenase I [Chondrinema litorale]|uniref:bifunctional aspartate kinase/homoserine dehydrogenase I n=1 Tax=Chondrinema litorale TaxID=2994555 RepID=UPI0025443A65|nr:bifunctional aspartate kinase/homoserine dehydrogenase I [Chondrinema litorale]UZR94541.1 bifunctional aspartate kinase/homoserine dehydrogenase I [Chondrinema litorale]
MKVLKFGGTSVGTPESIKQVIEIVKKVLKEEKAIVVVSAFGGLTDKLIHLSEMASNGTEAYKDLYKTIETRHLEAIQQLVHAKRQSGVIAQTKYILNELEDILHGIYLVKELSLKMKDFILSFGERLSAQIIAEAFKETGIDARYTDSRDLIITDRNFGNANVNFEETNQRMKSYFIAAQGELHIVPGFVGKSLKNETTTLGRGGSDYTASIIAAAINVDILEIWTDVNGMMTADPRKVNKAFTIPEISYEEAMELSYFGAKVIYPPSIQPVYQHKIPIHVKNTFDPNGIFTVISDKAKEDEKPIRGISSMKDISLVTLSGSGMIGVTGTSKRLFGCLADSNVNVILISQASSEHSISLAIAENDAIKAEKSIKDEFAVEFASKKLDNLLVENQMTIIAVVGKNMKSTPGVSGRLFNALGSNGVNVLAIAQGASELNISIVINKYNEEKALKLIHEAFFLSKTKALHIFIAGVTGLIGKTLIKQIEKQSETLKKQIAVDIRVIGLTNSRKRLINPDGFEPETCINTLETKGKVADLPQFINNMIEANLPNSIFVDATASKVVADSYEKILNASIAIVTPNKLACSVNYEYYKKLKEVARKRNTRFLFETNVAAGLPVISTLNDLINSGDKILKIEAILSGTLNYITNNVSQDKSISAVIKDAVKAGLTEPDPRIDLSGSDVARKILILGRELGHKLEMSDVIVEKFVPEESLETPDLRNFLEKLEAFDDTFERRRSEAEAEGKKFRVIATFENGIPKVEMKSFDQNHPFYHAKGSDNIVLFTSNRYKELPLMIKGPGAGAEVTAAGVFADIIRIAY